MARTQTYVVSTEKKPTYFKIDGAEPLEGGIPLKFHIWGYLMGINPDGSEGGLGAKEIKGIVNGQVIYTGKTGIWPWHENGRIDLEFELKSEGTYEIHLEFAGDAEWADG